MNWFNLGAKGNHGYPQPEDDYEKVVFSDSCPFCGVHGKQINPFRVKRSMVPTHSHFFQLNWLFDMFFVRREVEEELKKEKITGITFLPVIDHKSDKPLESHVQLCISSIIAGADTIKLPTVTCKPNNEESHLPGPAPSSNEFCGNIKWHPPTKLVIKPDSLAGAPDFFQTYEWFGSGGQAFRQTICSEKIVKLSKEYSWRGISFKSVETVGNSERSF